MLEIKNNILDFELKTTMKFEKMPLLEIIEGVNRICIFSRGNISCSTGQAKSRKTFGLTMLASSMLQFGRTYDKFFCPIDQMRIVYIFTEESKPDAINAGKRVQKIKGLDEQPPNFRFFWLRRLSPSQRVEMMVQIIEEIKPDFVFIDGIRDMVTDINNADQATEISTLLLKITDELNNHIHCVIHQNPGVEKMRGHLGTELMNKSETILSIAKDVDNKTISIVKPQEIRGKEFKEFCFEIYDNIPVLSNYEPIQRKRSKKQEEDAPF
jgi:RecA-family ATPase